MDQENRSQNNTSEEITNEVQEPTEANAFINEREFQQIPEREPKKKSKLSFSLSVLVTVMIFTMLITFLITALWVSNYKDARFEASVEEINQLLDEFNSTVLGVRIDDEARLKLYRYLLELDTMFQTYEFNDYDYEAVMDHLLHAYAAAVGDPYAEYYNKQEFADMMASMQGENQGVGISITYDSNSNAIIVLNVMPNSPAIKAGVLPGDLIVAVGIADNKEYVADLGYTAAVLKLQGVKGTMAEFTVLRGDEYIEFSIERDEYENQSVLWHVYSEDSTVAVVSILNFDALTPSQFEEAMEELYAKGIRKVVFDVRNNPGGNLNAIVDVLDMILAEGPIIRIVDKTGNTVQQIDSGSSAKYTDVKFAVLANENTASAAELFTSALMDHERAVSVGVTTYGKGSMQSSMQLTDNRGVKITTYHYLPPYSDSYEGIGIVPDIVEELSDELKNKNIFLIDDKDDNQLRAAVDAIK